MSSRTQNAETVEDAFEAMVDKIAGIEITKDQQISIDKAKSLREEYRNTMSTLRNN